MFEQPTPVDQVDLAFGGKMDKLMPSQASIPDEFKNFNSRNVWVEWQSDWFFNGLKQNPTPKVGVDLNAAMRHLRAIQASFEPKHEHKTSAVAYLASLWFDKP